MPLTSPLDEHETDEHETHEPPVDQAPPAIDALPAEEAPPAAGRDFEDLSLAEAAGQFFRAPRMTFAALVTVARTPAEGERQTRIVLPAPVRAVPAAPVTPEETAITRRDIVRLSMWIIALITATFGSFILIGAPTRFEARQLMQGAPFLLAGFVIWLAAEIVYAWPVLRRRGGAVAGMPVEAVPFLWEDWPLWRLGGVAAALGLAWVAWNGSTNNQFSADGFGAWVLSIAILVWALVPGAWSPRGWWRKLREAVNALNFRDSWVLAALVVILLVGAGFRVADFYGTPPEMTSDHKEKLLDAARVATGARDIFFVNNGGREPAQFYLLALLSHLPGMEMDFGLLKLLATVESLITLPVLWWMGREVVGPRDRRLGNLVGLCLAALVAVSYWHVAITRLALRIVLTPLITALLVIFLSRGLRHQRRADFVYAGLVLGFGLYCYQAVRMLPVVVIAAGLIGLLTSRPRQWTRVMLNFSLVVLVSFVVFVPLFRFSVDYPEFFWMRTTGRLLGDAVIQETAPDGTIRYREAALSERIEAFGGNLSVLSSNLRNALLMFNWKGDVAWINGYPNHPAMDAFTGSLLIVGLAAWLVLCVRTRDPALLLIPVAVFIMLLPSALSIAQPIENPSATRTSGALPTAYLLAAYPLALMVRGVQRLLRGWPGQVLGVGLVSGIALLALVQNSTVYFTNFRESYVNSSLPYSDAGRTLREFTETGGSLGNAYMIAYVYWWDHTIVGMEAGVLNWPNGVVTREDTPNILYEARYCRSVSPYTLNPDQDLLFFYNQNDQETEDLLRVWFPSGVQTVVPSYQPNDDFKIYRIPALGVEALDRFLEANTSRRAC